MLSTSGAPVRLKQTFEVSNTYGSKRRSYHMLDYSILSVILNYPVLFESRASCKYKLCINGDYFSARFDIASATRV